jgi:hypothetical protein
MGKHRLVTGREKSFSYACQGPKSALHETAGEPTLLLLQTTPEACSKEASMQVGRKQKSIASGWAALAAILAQDAHVGF